MKLLTDGTLRINTSRPKPTVIRVDWLGRSEQRFPGEALNPFLAGLLSDAQASNAEIDMHFEGLDFFNSSTVTVLIHFLQQTSAARVRLTFRYLPTRRWQKLSFEALRVFEHVAHMVHVVPVSDASAGSSVNVPVT
ncbi:MAG: hypothetical protein ACJ790_16780 [Myxococcaceae bacterium]